MPSLIELLSRLAIVICDAYGQTSSPALPATSARATSMPQPQVTYRPVYADEAIEVSCFSFDIDATIRDHVRTYRHGCLRPLALEKLNTALANHNIDLSPSDLEGRVTKEWDSSREAFFARLVRSCSSVEEVADTFVELFPKLGWSFNDLYRLKKVIEAIPGWSFNELQVAIYDKSFNQFKRGGDSPNTYWRFLSLPIIDRLTGHQFVDLVEFILHIDGFRTGAKKYSSDFGGDLIVERDGVRCAIQIKRYSTPVGVNAVKNAITAKIFYHADRALVISNSFYTQPAHDLACMAGVRLLDRAEFYEWKEAKCPQVSFALVQNQAKWNRATGSMPNEVREFFTKLKAEERKRRERAPFLRAVLIEEPPIRRWEMVATAVECGSRNLVEARLTRGMKEVYLVEVH